MSFGYTPKERKKAEIRAKKEEAAKKCACGNFSGPDGLCNACRSARSNSNGPSRPSIPRPARLLPRGEPKSKAEAARRAVLIACPQSVSDDVVEYLADTAAALFEEDVTPDSVQQELESTFLPLLSDYEVSAEDAAAICKLVVDNCLQPSSCSARDAAGAHQPSSQAAHEGTVLCCVPNLMLMYGGSPAPLLKDATLRFLRGHRYGVVGANGSGKTTLMHRIATKGIVGLPDTLRVVHLSHDRILEGVSETTSVREYAQLRNHHSDEVSQDDVMQALVEVGFEEDLLGRPVVALSGGWQMRLALACAMVQKANLFLLDEPTNHLDAAGVAWLVEFIRRACGGKEAEATGMAPALSRSLTAKLGSSAMIVSHDADFLDQVCTDIIHFSSGGKLEYHSGDFSEFKMSQLDGDEDKAQQLLATTSSARKGAGLVVDDRMVFPDPGRIGSTVSARKAPLLTLQNVSFTYKSGEALVLRGVDVKLASSSRVGIVGSNGSGKSTLLALLAGRLHPSSVHGDSPGELWMQKGLRLSYVAQHSLVHIGEFLESTPLEYMYLRFRRGFDEETPILLGPPRSPRAADRLKMLAARHGKGGKTVEALLSRIEWQDDDGEQERLYEVQWTDLGPGQKSFEKPDKLKELGVDDLMAAFDERLWHSWGEAGQRPLEENEVVRHLGSFGLSDDVTCKRKLSMLSSGQKAKLVFGAAFWTRPHILCLDEPTNYLDVETVELLQKSIRSFRGGVAVVSHNSSFVGEVCNEVWEVKDGQVTVSQAKKR